MFDTDGSAFKIGRHGNTPDEYNINRTKFYRNYIDNVATAIVLWGGSQDTEIYNNVIHDVSGHAFMENNDRTGGVAFNNTFINTNNLWQYRCGPNSPYAEALVHVCSSGTEFTNNLFYTSDPSDLLLHGGSNALFSDNLWYNSNEGYDTIINWTKGTNVLYSESDSDLTNWNNDRGLTGDEVAQFSDPGLSDIANHNLSPIDEDAAVVNTGTNLGADYELALDWANSNFTAYPPVVVAINQNSYGAGWEKGAVVYGSSDAAPSPPTSLRIVGP